MDWMVWKKYPFPPAWGSNSQWDSIGVEMCDQLCGARLGLAGGKQGGQLVVQLGYQLTIKARLNMNKFMGKIIKKKIKKITHSSTTRTKKIKIKHSDVELKIEYFKEKQYFGATGRWHSSTKMFATSPACLPGGGESLRAPKALNNTCYLRPEQRRQVRWAWTSIGRDNLS